MKREIFRYRLLFGITAVIVFFLTPSSSFAAPSIASVSGTFSPGEMITISGSGFGTKARPGPILWDTFESGAAGAVVANETGGAQPFLHEGDLASYGTWILAGRGAVSGNQVVLNGAAPKPGSTLHARATFLSDQYTGLGLFVPFSRFATGQDLYISYAYRFTRTGASFPRRTSAFSLVHEAGAEALSFGTAYGSCETGGYRQRVESLGTEYPLNTDGTSINGEWVRFEQSLQQSGDGAANGSWVSTIYRSSPPSKDMRVSLRQILRTSSAIPSAIVLGAVRYEMCGNDPGTIDIDDVYIDTTPARVELCDTPTWAARNECEAGLPSLWNEERINLTLRGGSFSSGTRYLYVIDASGAVNTVGFPISFGETRLADETAPLPPSALLASPRASSVSLSWMPSTDRDISGQVVSGFDHYSLERCEGSSCENFSEISSVSSDSFVDRSRAPSTAYAYRIRAIDRAGNASSWSDIVRVTTLPLSFVSCETVNQTNFSESLYSGYGAPYDVFSPQTILLSTSCQEGNIHTVKPTVGVPGDMARIVYTTGYRYDPTVCAWQPFSLDCTGVQNGKWCQGFATTTLTNETLFTATASMPAYVAGMTCSVQNGSWKCGCRDANCSTFSWQIQGAKKEY